MNELPIARTRDLVVQQLSNEILIYDLAAHKAYCLNETSSTVYKACDGKTLLSELKAKSKLSDEIIYLALEELKKENLIEEGRPWTSPFAAMSRREVIRKVGLASVIALPVVSSLVAPAAVHAASACGTACTGSANCSAPCPSCQGSGICQGTNIAGFPSCSNIGTACVVSGTCVAGPFPGTLICSSTLSAPCSTLGAPCSIGGSCVGTGTCH